MNQTDPGEYRSGFVAVVGRPNVGKSTLVNRILGAELSIVTPKKQTTRNRITAIYTTDSAQIILQDTPGIHEPGTALNRHLVATAFTTLEEADAILLLATPHPRLQDEDHRIISHIRAAGKACILAINKIDIFPKAELLPVIDTYSKAHEFHAIIPISALNGDGVPQLVDALTHMLPKGPPLFPTDEISDMPTKFFVAEMVREQVTRLTGEEIPYKATVMVESFKEERGIVIIHADIHVERDSQKKIVIGKQGQMIKAIGIAARKKIEEFLENKVHLELFVKVTPNWSRDERRLREFGYKQ
jgi:GTPase